MCGDQTGGTLTALENVIPPGEGPPLHAHANEDELFFGRFAEHDGPDPSAFKSIGAEVGMDVLGPPLAQSDPV